MSIVMRITHCPTCGSDRIEKVQRTLTGEFRGQPYSVPALEFYECPDCGERVYDRDAMRQIEAHSPAFAGAHIDTKPHVTVAM
jgi:YgiT-type zinc finger domain-containing protein